MKKSEFNPYEKIKKIILFILPWCMVACNPLIHILNYNDNPGNRKKVSLYRTGQLDKSISANSYQFMSLRSYLGINNSLLSTQSNKKPFIKEQNKLIDNLIRSSSISRSIPNNTYKYKDNYRGWIVKKANERNKGTNGTEVPLFESYSFFYVAQYLSYLKEIGWPDKNQKNQNWWDSSVEFLETNIWEKWQVRSRKTYNKDYRTFLRGRTHMGSHWAGIGMYLLNISSNEKIQEQAKKVVDDFDLLLKRNLQPNPIVPSAYLWNSTYDDITGTDAAEVKDNIVQDVSHGNHVISYIVAAYEMGNKKWTIEDIQMLCNTLKLVIWDPEHFIFKDNVDGSKDESRPGWGNFVADGWIKLAAYDDEVKDIFEKFETNNYNTMRKYGQEIQFKSNMISLNTAG